MTQEQDLKIQHAIAEIATAKDMLTSTDYKCMKYAEGELSAEEYEPIRIERRALRARINELEKELGV